MRWSETGCGMRKTTRGVVYILIFFLLCRFLASIERRPVWYGRLEGVDLAGIQPALEDD